jgi:hypothetical protein
MMSLFNDPFALQKPPMRAGNQTGGQKHTFWPSFFAFSQRQTGVSLAVQRNEEKKTALKK